MSKEHLIKYQFKKGNTFGSMRKVKYPKLLPPVRVDDKLYGLILDTQEEVGLRSLSSTIRYILEDFYAKE